MTKKINKNIWSQDLKEKTSILSLLDKWYKNDKNG